jgi:hypothetical protein
MYECPTTQPPEDVVFLDVPERAQVVGDADHIPAVDVDHTLGFAGRAARIQDVEWVLRIDGRCLSVDAGCIQ